MIDVDPCTPRLKARVQCVNMIIDVFIAISVKLWPHSFCKLAQKHVLCSLHHQVSKKKCWTQWWEARGSGKTLICTVVVLPLAFQFCPFLPHKMVPQFRCNITNYHSVLEASTGQCKELFKGITMALISIVLPFRPSTHSLSNQQSSFQRKTLDAMVGGKREWQDSDMCGHALPSYLSTLPLSSSHASQSFSFSSFHP